MGQLSEVKFKAYNMKYAIEILEKELKELANTRDGKTNRDDYTLNAEAARLHKMEEVKTALNLISSKVHVSGSYPLGTEVMKPKGYSFRGIVVAAFTTIAGKERYVVDNGEGLLHIFNAEQLERVIYR